MRTHLHENHDVCGRELWELMEQNDRMMIDGQSGELPRLLAETETDGRVERSFSRHGNRETTQHHRLPRL